MQARLTPLGGLGRIQAAGASCDAKQPFGSRLAPPTRSAGLVLTLLVLAYAAASVALIYFRSSVASVPVATQVVKSADPHTAARSPITSARWTGHALALGRVTRGGASTSVVVRATLPQSAARAYAAPGLERAFASVGARSGNELLIRIPAVAVC